jgi:hypothetical protein
MTDKTICYICGQTLVGKINKDHVPMKQLYGKEYRRITNPNLFCLPTHQKCNKSFQKDEEYFVYTFIPIARETPAGKYVAEDVKDRARSGEQRPLLHLVLKQFAESIKGASADMRMIKIDGSRVWRVIWKIAKGLYYKEKQGYLSDDVPKYLSLYGPDDRIPDTLKDALTSLETRADYPPVFDYRYRQFPEVHNAHLFLMTLWDTYLFEVVFHDPDCLCEACVL